jgi:hypothetical protein
MRGDLGRKRRQGFAQTARSGPRPALALPSQFGEQRLADRLGFVGGDALFTGGQYVNDETVLGDFERNDVVKCA